MQEFCTVCLVQHDHLSRQQLAVHRVGHPTIAHLVLDSRRIGHNHNRFQA
jgi:hypothetical protein